MKYFITLICTLACFTNSHALKIVDILQDTTYYSKEHVIELISKELADKDVDIYECTDYGEIEYLSNKSDTWVFFVDANPLANWAHECYLMTYPKYTASNKMIASPKITKKELLLPPNCTIIPAKINVREDIILGKTTKSRINVPKQINSRKSLGNTYAIILSGGGNKSSNHPRYWNDCSFIYQTLTKRYRIPKSNITVLMSDGTSQSEDTYEIVSSNTIRYYSSSHDLDFDGKGDINYSATKNNIKYAINNLLSNSDITEDDQLLVFVTDHGGLDRQKNESYIVLWNEELLYANELAQLLSQFTSRRICVNVVMGQCNSGGFIEHFNMNNCVLATACTKYEYSYARNDLKYDDFIYHWICSINGYDEFGNNLVEKADTNNDYCISAREAFDYSLKHDSHANSLDPTKIEHPQYHSNSHDFGDSLAVDYTPEWTKLSIKDKTESEGPALKQIDNVFWNSPDIWCRNQEDEIEEHEDPYFSTDHSSCFVNVRIHNIGDKQYENGKFVHLYWSFGSTVNRVATWLGHETCNGLTTGGVIGSAAIPAIAKGESTIIKIPWSISQSDSTLIGNDNFSILAFISKNRSADSSLYVTQTLLSDIKDNHNMALKNVSTIKASIPRSYKEVYVRNFHSNIGIYDITLNPATFSQMTKNETTATMFLSENLYNAWTYGGSLGQGITDKSHDGNYIIEIDNSCGSLKNITLRSYEIGKIKIGFVTNNKVFNKSDPQKLFFNLKQSHANGSIIGGEVLIQYATNSLGGLISTAHISSSKVRVSVDQPQISSTTWFDQAGNMIGTESSVEVQPTPNNKKYSVSVVFENGNENISSIELEPALGLKSVSHASDYSTLNIELYNAPEENGHILSIHSVDRGTQELSYNIAVGEESINLDVSAMPSGIYLLSYSIGGRTVDNTKIIF